MSQIKLQFKIDDNGHLLWSQDGCHWEDLGLVAGNGSDGQDGINGHNGIDGRDGSDGIDGQTPYIKESTGTWCIGNFDTGVVAAGSNGEIDIEVSPDISQVGTPSVTKRIIDNKVILQFHKLKGESGEAPIITAERVGHIVYFKVNGVIVATLFDGIQYTAGSHITITEDDIEGSIIACNLTAGDGVIINENNEICVTLQPNNGKLTIKGGETTVTEFTANQSTDKTIKFIGTTGISVQGNATTSQITISTESNHTVVSKTGILTNGSQYGSQAYELGVRCDLSGVIVKAVDLDDFATEIYSTPSTFKYIKNNGESNKYAGIFGINSTDGCFVFKININNTATGKIESHLYGVIADSPEDATFLFVTTNSWPLVCKYNIYSLYAYMQIPDDFVGNIIITPMRKKINSGGSVYCFEPTGISDNTPSGKGWNEEGVEYTLGLYSSADLYGTDISYAPGGVRTPSGRYNVDVIEDFGGSIVVGSKIADNVINDYILHALSKKVDSLVNNYSLTLGNTTITESQLQALLAILQ